MKQFLSISFSLFILLSGMNFSISTHYCCGKIAASRVSFSGERASCGMEDSYEQSLLSGKYFSTHCCDDEVTVLAVDNNYTPSFSEYKAFPQHILQVFGIPANFWINSLSALNLICTNVSPPDIAMVSNVSLPKICVFRI